MSVVKSITFFLWNNSIFFWFDGVISVKSFTTVLIQLEEMKQLQQHQLWRWLNLSEFSGGFVILSDLISGALVSFSLETVVSFITNRIRGIINLCFFALTLLLLLLPSSHSYMLLKFYQ